MFVPAPAAGSVSNGEWQYIKVLRTGNVAVLTDDRGTQLAIAEFGKVLEYKMCSIYVVVDFSILMGYDLGTYETICSRQNDYLS